VNILDRVEQRIEQVMEGGIGRLFRSPVQPAEIGQKLERAMSERPVVSVGGVLAPNHFRVRLHPGDFAQFVAYQAALERQLAAWLTEVARRRRFTLVDQIEVELTASERVPRRAIEVIAIITERPPGVAARDDQAPRFDEPGPARSDLAHPVRLRFLNGPKRSLETTIAGPVTTVGRAPNNDIVLDVGDVSRHHARLERAGSALRVVDLGSTNGTRVNGQPVSTSLLRPGDEVSFGTIRAQVVDRE
jgi:hypothetical protein